MSSDDSIPQDSSKDANRVNQLLESVIKHMDLTESEIKSAGLSNLELETKTKVA